jgi:hypothetical protein
MKLENLLANVIKEYTEVRGKKIEELYYNVEPEVIKWARLHAQFFIDRYKGAPEDIHWPEEDERKNYIGMIGHKCFDLTLTQFEIPKVPNDPVVMWTWNRPYDFNVPEFGTVEVKTIDFQLNQKRLIIRESNWHKCDWVVAVKLLDALPTKVKIVGAATKEEVENNFHFSEEGEFPCFKASCYWKFLEDLAPALPFFDTIMHACQKVSGRK